MRAAVLATALVLGLGAPADAGRFNWDALGAKFCAAAASGDTAALAQIVTPELGGLIGAARAASAGVPARALFQAYDAEATCTPRTRNAALVELHRRGPSGSPSWTDYLVIVPERDGTMRVDDILFATGRSDTLRVRLRAAIEGR